MAVSRINSTTGTNSLTFASPVAGYIQLVFAFRDGSNTAPTVPTPGTGNAWTTIGSASGANTCSSVAVWRYVASGSDTASGTFTNATSIIGVQYSGVHATSAIGDNSDTGASSNSVNFNALSSMVDTSGSSWAVGFVGHRATDGTITTAPSGMTNVTSVSDATDQAAIHDTNAGVTSWSTTSASLGGTSSGYRARVIEVRAAGATTLTAGVGSYTMTGTAATLKYGRILPAAVGSYSITGTAATLKYGRTIAAAVGSYAITGTAAGLKRGYTLAAAVGSYALSGVDATLKKAITLVGDVGSYILTGTDATLTHTGSTATTITADPGSYTLTGTDATLTASSASTTTTTPGGFLPVYEFKDKPKKAKLKKGIKSKPKPKTVIRQVTAEQLNNLAAKIAPKLPDKPDTSSIKALVEREIRANRIFEELRAVSEFITNDMLLIAQMENVAMRIKQELLRKAQDEKDLEQIFLQLIIEDII